MDEMLSRDSKLPQRLVQVEIARQISKNQGAEIISPSCLNVNMGHGVLVKGVVNIWPTYPFSEEGRADVLLCIMLAILMHNPATKR